MFCTIFNVLIFSRILFVLWSILFDHWSSHVSPHWPEYCRDYLTMDIKWKWIILPLLFMLAWDSLHTGHFVPDGDTDDDEPPPGLWLSANLFIYLGSLAEWMEIQVHAYLSTFCKCFRSQQVFLTLGWSSVVFALWLLIEKNCLKLPKGDLMLP